MTEIGTRETLVTQQGFDKLQEEYDRLVNEKRQQVAQRIKIAREDGDITENAEYDDAKNEQARVETRILQLEERLRTAKVVSDISNKTVGIGNKVTVREIGKKTEETFTIVGSTEADPLDGKVSNESPVGGALMGRKKGDKVEVPVPRGTVKYEVVKIAKG